MKSEYHWTTVDHLRRTTTEQATEIERLRRELAIERFRRLSLEIANAIRCGDRDAWGRLVSERFAVAAAIDPATVSDLLDEGAKLIATAEAA